MKTLRLFGLTLMAILLSVNFTSCSNEDDPTKDPEKLTGEWILTYEKEWGTEEGTNFNEETSYDFNTPEDGSEKMVIKEGTNKNEFELTYYYYSESSEEWEYDYKMTIKLDGNNIILSEEDDEEDIVSSKYTYSLKDNKLTIKSYVKYTDDSEYNYEETYQKK